MDIAKLALENGRVFTGAAFGARGEIDGEVVFNTSMTGYQEILTDPSYHGQIVAMTYPLIGNYGVNSVDVESGRPWVRGFLVRELSRSVSNYRSEGSLEEYLTSHGILGIEGIDTRALVKLTRERGALKGVISTIDLDDERLVKKAIDSPGLVGRDLTREVMPDRISTWDEGLHEHPSEGARGTGPLPHVVALDFGMKWNIPRHLVDQGCRVTVVPGSSVRRKTSASGFSSASGGKPWLAVMALMRMAPRSGQMTPEPTRRKCGATSRRSICSSVSLVSAKTIQEGWVPLSLARTSMRRTMPSEPGAVET